MRGSNKIQHRPYCPPIFRESLKKPYICRLAPGKDYIEFEWFDNFCGGTHTVWYGIRGCEEKTAMAISEPVVKLCGLESNVDYEFYIEAENGLKSNLRLARTGSIPEGAVVINYLHPEDGQYDFSGRFLSSPSVARTKSGRIVAGMDVFAGRDAQTLTLLFKSEDDGKTWRYLTDLHPFYWASLFYHRDVLYILGLTTEYGNLQIACSEDEGETWSAPVTLFYGSNYSCKYGGVHRAPMQINSYNGRLYTSCEYGCWQMGSHLPAVLSIDENADLMDPENWYRSEFLPFDGAWKEAANGKQFDTMEGNIIRGPDGNLYNYMRWCMGRYLRLKINEQDIEAPLEFAGIFEAPVSNSMFRIIPDGDKYLVVTNRKTDAATIPHSSYRNVLTLFETKDMVNFKFIKDIVNFEDQDPKLFGFQYPTYLYENGVLSLVVRSSFNGAEDFHNANYSLFFRV